MFVNPISSLIKIDIGDLFAQSAIGDFVFISHPEPLEDGSRVTTINLPLMSPSEVAKIIKLVCVFLNLAAKALKGEAFRSFFVVSHYVVFVIELLDHSCLSVPILFPH